MDLPFLYQTRTITQIGRSTARQSRRLLKPSVCRRRLTQHAQPELRDVNQTSFFREKAEAVAARLGQPEGSTITREEQRAFNNLRRLAGQSHLQAQQLDSTPEAALLSVEPKDIISLFVPPASSQSSSKSEINEICSDYISSVSKSLQKALKTTKEQGDYAIWRVLQGRVFPLLAFLKTREEASKAELGLAVAALPKAKSIFQSGQSQRAVAKADAPKSATTNAEARIEASASQEAHDGANDDAEPSTPPSQLAPLPILTRVYPAVLLLALRLLTKHYPVSTLTHALLPYIRSLGAPSYILGTNTYFYNTVILLRWNVYSSLQEIDTLLSEMQQGAVEFDRSTARVLADIAEERWQDLNQHESNTETKNFEESVGARGAAWWTQPRQEEWWPRIEEWRSTVNRHLEEKGMGQVHREGSSINTASSTGDGGSPKIWL